jgi:8-oxo-dGTP diphosphatase
MSNPHHPEELIAMVDDNDNVIGKYPRKNHTEGRLHRETSVLIVNPNNEILVQVRADSGRLDYSDSGHFPVDEDYLDGAIREVQEELGLDIPRDKFVKISKHRIDYSERYVNKRFITLWEVRGDYKIECMNIDPTEVKSVKYMPVSELKRIIKEKPNSMSAGFIDSLQIYFTKKGL